MAEDNFINKVAIDSCCSKEDKKDQHAASANTNPATSQIKNIAEEHKEEWNEHLDVLAALAILIVHPKSEGLPKALFGRTFF